MTTITPTTPASETAAAAAPVFAISFRSPRGASGLFNSSFDMPEFLDLSPAEQERRLGAAVYLLHLLTPHTQSTVPVTHIELTINGRSQEICQLRDKFDKLLHNHGKESGQIITGVIWALAEQVGGNNDLKQDFLGTYADAYGHHDAGGFANPAGFVNAAWYRFLQSIQQRTT